MGIQFDIIYKLGSKLHWLIILPQVNQVCRYPQNPEENWGPKARAGMVVKRPVDEGDDSQVPSKAAKKQ